MKQSSLFSFFGKGKKKRRASDNDNNDASGGSDSDSSSPAPSRPPARKQTKTKTSNGEDSNESHGMIAQVVTPSNDDESSDDVPMELSRSDKEKAAPAASSGVDDSAEKAHPPSPVTDTTGAAESSDGEEESDNGDDASFAASGNDGSGASNDGHGGKSAYELLREKNIARNNARLRALGLLAGVDHALDSDRLSNANRHAKRKKNKAAAAAAAALPTRRSSRLRKPVVMDVGLALEVEVHHDDETAKSCGNNSESGKAAMEAEEEFTVSPLIEYQMTNNNITRYNHTENNDGGTNYESNDSAVRISTLSPIGPRLVPPSGLNAIYSLQWFHPPNGGGDGSSWLVGAGKSGLVALWDASQPRSKYDANGDDTVNEDIEPVISWRGHGGRWIADARFLSPSLSGLNGGSAHRSFVPDRLLTAGNDGAVCHWDLTSASLTTGAPKLLAQSGRGLHASGIFSMDVSGGGVDGNGKGSSGNRAAYIVTGSKDKTLAVSALDRLDGAPLWRSEFHGAKVGSVCFSSCQHNPMIASASDDGLVAVHDVRVDGTSGGVGGGDINCGGSVVASLQGAHAKPHSAVWMPHSNTMLMTAGLDEVIKLWDLRNTSRPITSYHGHVPGGGKRLKRIHRPVFYNTTASSSPSLDSFILSGGEGSRAISMFRIGGVVAVAGAGDRHSNGCEEEQPPIQSVFSRGKLPPDVGDIGSLAVRRRDVAVAVEGGEVMMLSPKA